MEMSTDIKDLAAALAKAQGEMGGAVKDSANPFFKSKYADLSSVMDACRGPLAKHGLSVVQSPSSDGARVSVETLLLHTSGQWIRGVASASAKDDQPQSIGSAITYLRRYALQSFAGVAPEDDDAEAATNRSKAPAGQASAFRRGEDREKPSAPNGGDSGHKEPPGYAAWLDELAACAFEGKEQLRLRWEASPKPFREHITRTAPEAWAAMKAKAATVAA